MKYIKSAFAVFYNSFSVTLIGLFFCYWLISCSTSTKVQGVNNDGSIKVLSYNIHHANPPSKPGIIDIDAISKVIRDADPDLVALQEVDVRTNRSGKDLNQASVLALKTKMNFYFAKAIDHDGGEYGVALLSKYPLTNPQKHDLPTILSTKGEPRVLATVEVNLPNTQKMLFACTHMDAQRSDSNRVLQIEKITNILKGQNLPVILAGDFNDVAGSAVINTLDQHLTRTCIDNCGYTIPEVNPTRTIDFVAVTPGKFSVQETTVIAETYASDHRPVLAVVRLLEENKN